MVLSAAYCPKGSLCDSNTVRSRVLTVSESFTPRRFGEIVDREGD